MKLLLTPVGLGDPVIDGMPDLDGLIPATVVVTVLVCNDGRNDAHLNPCLDRTYLTRLFLKLCNKGNRTVTNIRLMQISFFEPYDLFFAKLRLCDIFYMAGFTSKVTHVEPIYLRGDPDMTLKRHAVANRCVTNSMLFWAVCGSAVSCGMRWDITWSSRTLPPADYQMFEMLADGRVDYQACSGAVCQITEDLAEWHITSGIGLMIVVTPTLQTAKAFCCVKKQRSAYHQICAQMQPKLSRQVRRLATLTDEYRTVDGATWRFHWGNGIVEWSSVVSV